MKLEIINQSQIQKDFLIVNLLQGHLLKKKLNNKSIVLSNLSNIISIIKPMATATIKQLINENNTDELDELLTKLQSQNVCIDDLLIDGLPLLFMASIHGKVDCVRVVIKHCEDINKKYTNGSTVLHKALIQYANEERHERKQEYLQIIKYLIECGIDINILNDQGTSHLILVCIKHVIIMETDDADRIDIVRLLIDRGADRRVEFFRHLTDDFYIQDYTAYGIARANGYVEIAYEIKTYQPIPLSGPKGVHE